MPSDLQATSAAAHPVGLDAAGIAASALCAVHCLVGPLVLALAPAMGRFWTDPLTHWIIALVVLPIALAAVWRGTQVHGRRWLLGLAALAATLILLALIVPPLLEAGHGHGHGHGHTEGHGHHHGDASAAHRLETALTVTGSLLLVIVHLVNIRGCLQARCAQACQTCEDAGEARG